LKKAKEMVMLDWGSVELHVDDVRQFLNNPECDGCIFPDNRPPSKNQPPVLDRHVKVYVSEIVRENCHYFYMFHLFV
jgi:hypothetical protein